MKYCPPRVLATRSSAPRLARLDTGTGPAAPDVFGVALMPILGSAGEKGEG